MRTLGPYQLLRKVGSGGMAEVWSARKASDLAGEKFVAIKVLARHVAEDPRYREMFAAEARLSLALNHANIVTVFDVVQGADECYMVMELIEGMTLSQLVRGLAKRGETLPLQVAVYIVAELLRALAYAHGLETEQGATIVHRDISPQNVMVSTSGEVKLMDFGIARFSTEETSGNLVKGKLQYMPPEQLSKRTRAPTLDLFAVGGVLQELVEGRRFRGGVDQEILLGMVFRGEVPEMSVELPEPLATVRAQLLDPDPDKRIQSAKQALAQIYDWSGYRNASLALEELVCQFVEPSSATAMPVVAPEADDEAATVARDAGGELEALLAQRAASPWSSSGSGSGSTPAGPGPGPRPGLPPPSAGSGAGWGAAASSGSGPGFAGSGSGSGWGAGHELEAELDSEVDVVAHAAGTGGGRQVDPETEVPTSVDRPVAAAYAYGEVEPLTGGYDPRAGRKRGLVVAALLGLLVVLGVLGWQVGLLGPGDEPDPQALADASAPETIEAAAVEPDPDDGPAPPSGAADAGEAEANATALSLEQALAVDAPEPTPGPVRDGEDADEDADDEADEADDEGASDSPSKKNKAKVSVEFTASDFYFVYIKVAGRSLTLEPKKTVRLPVGSHAVYFRQKPDQDWKKAGSIRLGRGASYKVEMKKPGSLRLIKK